MMKGSKSNEKRKNFILFSVVFLTVFSLAIVLLYIDHRQSELRSSQTPLSSESGNLQTTPGAHLVLMSVEQKKLVRRSLRKLLKLLFPAQMPLFILESHLKLM